MDQKNQPKTEDITLSCYAVDTTPSPDPQVQGQGRKLSRRAFFIRTTLGVAGAGLLASGAGGLATQQLWQNAHSLPDMQTPGAVPLRIGHLLRRAGFGASPQEIEENSALGFEKAVDQLLNYKQVDDSQMENSLQALQLDLTKPAQQQLWWLLRMAWTKRPLLEKMTLFWHGLLVSSYRKVGGSSASLRMLVQNNFLREHAFDTYDALLLGITADPAMLVYLDLTRSNKRNPNENYSRELLELFTLGLGHYNQQDVDNGAAALTGWHISKEDPLKAVYLPNTHDTRTKTYLGQTGPFDYKDIIRILTHHPATPRLLCRKLFSFFAYENPSDQDLEPLIDAYNSTNHTMGAVMRALLLSPQFSSEKAYRSRIKSPIEFVVGSRRAFGLQEVNKNLPVITNAMGQELFNPPSVAGWPGDKASGVWLSSGTWMARVNYINALLSGTDNPEKKGKGKQLQSAIDLQKIVDANKLDSPERFVDYFASFLLDGNLPPAHRLQIVAYLSEDGGSEEQGIITFAGGKRYPASKVRGVLYLLMASPEYQLN